VLLVMQLVPLVRPSMVMLVAGAPALDVVMTVY
jgi:hypothetical protein